MMKKLWSVLFSTLLVLSLIGTPVLADQHNLDEYQFVEDLPDIPLMKGLSLVKGAGFVFEQEEGRIVEKMAIGPVYPKMVNSFYIETLPQLGWEYNGVTFTRNNENLRVIIWQEDNVSAVTFRLRPASHAP